jgi:hypothetical protein
MSTEREFQHWDDYSRFARHVRSSRRYGWSEEAREFLETVLATIRGRDVEFAVGHSFYRAQLGIDVIDRTDDDGNWIGEDTWGYSADRMKPLADRAREGRANATGIPALYVATTVTTAISEVRPWISADVSVALCKLVRPLRTLDLTLGHGKSSFAGPVFSHILGGRELTSAEKEAAVWIDIDNAFSEPVTVADDRADYAPTQILAELFQNAGYDAIGYKSHFGDEEDRGGYNIAVFDPGAVEVVGCAPWRVRSISVLAEQNGDPWSKRT